MSKGEDWIEHLLKRKKVAYIKEKTFPDFRGGKMRFDFFLPNLYILIEVDGEQHFKYNSYFYDTKKEFTHAKQNDYYKNSYALAHGYKLFRIPYWKMPEIQHYSDIFKDEFLVRNKWHNDQAYRKFLAEARQKCGA